MNKKLRVTWPEPPFNLYFIFMTQDTATPNRWYTELVQAVNGLGEELGLDDQGTQRLRDFAFEKAKEQFKAGNRSGIRWARTNPSTTRTAVAVA